jgi:hypothetical protein
MKFLDTFFASERYEGIRKYLNMLDFSEVPKKNLIIYIAISGIINTLLLSVLSSAANQDNAEGVDYLKLYLFAASLLVFYITKTYSLKSSVKAVENAIYETKDGRRQPAGGAGGTNRAHQPRDTRQRARGARIHGDRGAGAGGVAQTREAPGEAQRLDREVQHGRDASRHRGSSRRDKHDE